MKIQIDDEVQNATAEQIAIIEVIQSVPSIEEQIKAKTDAKIALFTKLGISEDEAKLLLG